MKKMFLRSLVLLISMFMIIVFSIAGCKEAAPIEEEIVEEEVEEAAPPEEKEEAPAEEPVEEMLKADLELWHWQPGENYKASLNEIIELFKAEHPNWELNIFQTISGGEEYWTAFAAKAVANDFPPLFGVLPGNNLNEYFGQLVDITDDIRGDPEWLEWAAGWIDHTEIQVDGKTYCTTIDKWDVGIWYWDILDDLSLEVPKTVDGLIALTEPLKDAGYIPMATGLQTIQQSTYLFANLAGQFGYNGIRDAEAGNIAWNNPDFLKCLTAINNVYQAGMYREDAIQQAYTVQDLQDFTNKDSWGFWMAGDYFAGSIPAEDAGDVRVIPYPLVEEGGETCFISSVGQTFAMPDTIDEDIKKVALAFMKFLSSPEASVVFLKNDIRPAGLVPEGYEYTNPIIKETIDKSSIYKEVNPYIDDNDILTALGDAITAMYLGQLSPEEVLQQMDSFMASR